MSSIARGREVDTRQSGDLVAIYADESCIGNGAKATIPGGPVV